MSSLKELQNKFSEIGLGKDSEREKLMGSISFNFDFSKNQNNTVERIVETNNTKTLELCQTGTR